MLRDVVEFIFKGEGYVHRLILNQQEEGQDSNSVEGIHVGGNGLKIVEVHDPNSGEDGVIVLFMFVIVSILLKSL